MKHTQSTELHNAQHLRIVVRAAWEDLVAAGQRHGQDSAAYAAQTRRSMALIHGQLEKVLTAAQTQLHREENGHYPT